MFAGQLHTGITYVDNFFWFCEAAPNEKYCLKIKYFFGGGDANNSVSSQKKGCVMHQN
jgi:hypothetical protein